MENKYVFIREENLFYDDRYNYDLRRADFSDAFIIPTVDITVPRWATLLLYKRGFEISLNNDGYRIVIPISNNYISITAPVYEFTDDCKYVKVCEEYTELWTDPEIYELGDIALKEIMQTTKEQQHQIFMDMFEENSVDGKIAKLTLWRGYGLPPKDAITSDFIPEGIIIVFHDYLWDIVYYMKEMDAENKEVKITIKDEEYIKHIIGKERRNITRIEKAINASYISVIQSN